MIDLERFNRSPYYQLLGMRASSEIKGRARVELPFDEKLTQLYGGVHGGALMTLADAAISIAVTTLLPEGERVVTTEVSVQFLEPAGRDGIIKGIRDTHLVRVPEFQASCVAARNPIGRSDERAVVIVSGGVHRGGPSTVVEFPIGPLRWGW